MSTRTKITHVAVRFKGTVYSLPAPNRHCHVIWHIAKTTGCTYVDARDEDQGFLDESGRYLNRKQALVSARLHDQIKKPEAIRMNMLFSEDLW